MANAAEVIKFPVPEMAIKELRVADIEDGYTRIANELLEAVMLAGLTQHQLLVFMAVMRKTYGFNKKSDWVSNIQLSELTGLFPHKCSAAKTILVKRKIFTMEGRVVGINKNLSEWISLPKSGNQNVPESGNKKAPYLKEVNLPESGMENIPESGKAPYPNRVTTKDKHTKDNKDNTNKTNKAKSAPVSFDPLNVTLPDWLNSEIWSSWVAYRHALKKPIKTQQTVTQAINLLGRSRDKGFTPDEIINKSIANGWQGLFEPDMPRAPSVARTIPLRGMPENFAEKNYGKTEIPSWAKE